MSTKSTLREGKEEVPEGLIGWIGEEVLVIDSPTGEIRVIQLGKVVAHSSILCCAVVCIRIVVDVVH